VIRRSSFRALLRPALSSALSFLIPAVLGAQAQATTGIIRGTSVDSSGAPVAALVTLRNTETNFRRSVQASDRGVYVATLLPLGTYEITARAVGYAPLARQNLALNVGQTLEVPLQFARSVMQMGAVTVSALRPTVDTRRAEAATALDAVAVGGLPNNGRNFLNLTTLTPNVAVTQGPDGDVLSVGGQRGIHNNVSVDGADFNNPFFGEQRGGQRPAFTFNLDAVREMVVVSQGANAEFGRSGGGFVNVITKSGSNTVHGTLHYYGKDGGISARPYHSSGTLFRTVEPDFRQHQFGFTLGGPLKKDKLFYFVAYDQQSYSETKQTTRPSSAALTQLQSFFAATPLLQPLANDFGAIQRSNDAHVAMVKLDWRVNERHNASVKYNFTNSRQESGTFDVDTWGRSANGTEKDFSNAINGSLASHFDRFDNEFRFQLAREDRPRDVLGPEISAGRKFPDTAMDFANGFRFGQPFFLPVEAFDTRIQVLDNVSWVKGNHLFKVGFEWNRTEEKQTFVGFANGRFIFTSVAGFQGYVQNGRNYVECSNPAGALVTTNNNATCPAGTSISGPVLLYLQQAGVGGRTVEQAGTQRIPQHDLALFIQDTWKPNANLTVNYGLRWEGQKQPDPITPPSQVFFAPLIGRTVTNATGSHTFPSDGTIPSDMMMFQPRLGIAWDVDGDGKQVVRGSAGLYYARIPGLNLASARSTNGSIGQTMFRNSALIGVLGAPPAYDQLLPAPTGTPFNPDVFVFDKDFRNPRTLSASVGYEREIASGTAASVSYTYAKTDFLTRFVNRNDAIFGSPWANTLPGGNGIGVLTTVESSAKSEYNGITLGLANMSSPDFQYQVNYTLSKDMSDDDNERDPFKFFYARADRLDREWGYSERDQRHRVNAWMLRKLPLKIYANNRFTYTSAQPRSAICATQPIGAPSDRICPTGTILQRNTLRRDNTFASWDLRLSRPFMTSQRGQVEAIVEIFNVTNRDNFRDPSASSLLFNFDGTIRSGLGDPRQVQVGARYAF
jgi:hypothetical protein